MISRNYPPSPGWGSAENVDFLDILGCYKLIFFDARETYKRSLNIEHCILGGMGFSRIFLVHFPTPTPRACYLWSLAVFLLPMPPPLAEVQKEGGNQKRKPQSQGTEGGKHFKIFEWGMGSEEAAKPPRDTFRNRSWRITLRGGIISRKLSRFSLSIALKRSW